MSTVETALEPILVEAEVSVEEYEVEVSIDDIYDVELETEIRIENVDGDPYEGSYVITPSIEEQMLDTDNKVLTDDVIILPIPYYETTNAVAAEVLLSKTAYVNGNKVTGTMPNNGAATGSISAKAQEYTIPRAITMAPVR